jgi:hypothetical protein
VRVKHPAGTVETHAGLARLEGGWVEFIPADGTYNERPSWTSGGEYLHDDVCAVAWPAARVCQVEWLIRENEAGPDLCAGGAELAEASCA